MSLNKKMLTQKETRAVHNNLKSSSNGNTPEVLNMVLTKMESSGIENSEIPQSVILIKHSSNSCNTDEDYLFLDRLPIPNNLWKYNKAESTLMWRSVYGGGSLFLGEYGGGYGVVGKFGSENSVQIKSRASFLCNTSSQCGVTYIESGGKNIGLKWDTEGNAWKNAAWDEKRLRLEYIVSTPTMFDPSVLTFRFEDKTTNETWDSEAFNATIGVVSRAGKLVWRLEFKASDCDPFCSLFPDFLEAEEDITAININGAMEVAVENSEGVTENVLFGICGVSESASLSGYYRMSNAKCPFGIFNGYLYINGEAVSNAYCYENELSWSNLDKQQSECTGLSKSGKILFSDDGLSNISISNGTVASVKNNVKLSKLSANDALRYIQAGQNSMCTKQMIKMESVNPDIITLLGLSPFEQDENKGWYDKIQKQVTDDMFKIINDSIPKDTWNTLFPNTPRTPLESYLSIIKSTSVEGEDPPSKWYESLAVAALTSGMSGSKSFESCKLLNGIRASKLMRSHMSSSGVYRRHSQLLFQHHWQSKYTVMKDYKNDEINNWEKNKYKDIITERTELNKKDIEKNVIATTEEDKKIKAELLQQLDNAKDYAIESKNFWAFAYYTYNISAAILSNIASQLSFSGGSGDGMTLTRMIQQNVSVLTALDESEFFVKKYVEAINTFLSTNILINMFDYAGDAASFDLISSYLKNIFEKYINSSDEKISKALSDLKDILDKEGMDVMIREAIEIVNSIAETTQDIMAFPYIAKRFVAVLEQKHPNLHGCGELFGTIIMGGLSGLAIFNMLSVCKSWNELSEAEKAELIVAATDLGIQMIAAVVKRGVRIYAIFKADNLSAGERAFGISKIAFKGGAVEMESGLIKIGNNFSRWLADTEGTYGKFMMLDSTGAMASMIVRTSEAEAKWVVRVFGRNLEEFVATRLGPMMILASIGFSIYNLTQKLSSLETAAEALNIASGALMLFAIAGEWAISAGIVAAGGILAGVISAAGFLGIVLAIVGIVVMICEIFSSPVSPVDAFIEAYARPNGLALQQQCGSLEYAIPYSDKSRKDLMMLGFQLTFSDMRKNNVKKTWKVSTESSLELTDNATYTSECIFHTTVDETGKAKIFTVAKEGNDKKVAVYLSLLNDGSIKFCKEDQKNVKTKWWFSDTIFVGLDSEKKYFQNAMLSLQAAVKKDTGYERAGYIIYKNDRVSYNDEFESLPLLIEMNPMAPEAMSMKDLKFTYGKTQYEGLKFGPSFDVPPSSPCKFTLSGNHKEKALQFLSFSSETGSITPIKDKMPEERFKIQMKIEAANDVGSTKASFIIEVI